MIFGVGAENIGILNEGQKYETTMSLTGSTQIIVVSDKLINVSFENEYERHICRNVTQCMSNYSISCENKLNLDVAIISLEDDNQFMIQQRSLSDCNHPLLSDPFVQIYLMMCFMVFIVMPAVLTCVMECNKKKVESGSESTPLISVV